MNTFGYRQISTYKNSKTISKIIVKHGFVNSLFCLKMYFFHWKCKQYFIITWWDLTEDGVLWGEFLQVTFLQNFRYSCFGDVGLKTRLVIMFQQDISEVFQQCISDIIVICDVCLVVIEADSNLWLRSAKWNSSQQQDLSPDKGHAVPELFFRCYDEDFLSLAECK